MSANICGFLFSGGYVLGQAILTHNAHCTYNCQKIYQREWNNKYNHPGDGNDCERNGAIYRKTTLNMDT